MTRVSGAVACGEIKGWSEITHLPKQGIQVSVRNEAPINVDNLAFAHVVWNVYMGPDGVCKELRRGLGEKLSAR